MTDLTKLKSIIIARLNECDILLKYYTKNKDLYQIDIYQTKARKQAFTSVLMDIDEINKRK